MLFTNWKCWKSYKFVELFGLEIQLFSFGDKIWYQMTKKRVFPTGWLHIIKFTFLVVYCWIIKGYLRTFFWGWSMQVIGGFKAMKYGVICLQNYNLGVIWLLIWLLLIHQTLELGFSLFII